MAATDYDYILTLNQLMEQAYRKIGVVVQGESMTAEQRADAVIRLNLILKEWESDKVFLWREHLVSVPLVVGTEDYAVETDPAVHWVDRAYLRKDNRDTALEYLSWREFQEIYDKTTEGRPTTYSFDARNRRIYLWPVPSEADTLRYLAITSLKDWTDANSSGEFPARWQRPLLYTLAADLAEDYADVNMAMTLQRQALTSYMKARRAEVDESENDFTKGSYE